MIQERQREAHTHNGRNKVKKPATQCRQRQAIILAGEQATVCLGIDKLVDLMMEKNCIALSHVLLRQFDIPHKPSLLFSALL